MNNPQYAVLPEGALMSDMHTNKGQSVAEIADQRPVLLIFLRHFGCIFCQESLRAISITLEKKVGSVGEVIFVHMSTPELAQKHFNRFGMTEAKHISDPDNKYYAAFGLSKGSLSQLFGLKNWINGFSAISKKGVMPAQSPALGDPWQMPGIFLVYKGKVRERFIHDYAAQRPDYARLLEKCEILAQQ